MVEQVELFVGGLELDRLYRNLLGRERPLSLALIEMGIGVDEDRVRIQLGREMDLETCEICDVWFVAPNQEDICPECFAW